MRSYLATTLVILACSPLTSSRAAEQQDDLVLLTMRDGTQVTVEMATGVPYSQGLQALKGLRWGADEPVVAWFKAPATSRYVPSDQPDPLELYQHALSGAAEYYLRRQALDRLIEKYRDVVQDKIGPDGGEAYVREYARLHHLYVQQYTRILTEDLTRDQFVDVMNRTFPASTWNDRTWNSTYDSVVTGRTPNLVGMLALPWSVNGAPAPWVWGDAFESRVVQAITDHEIEENGEDYLAATKAKMGSWRCFIIRNVQPGTAVLLAKTLETFADKDGTIALKGLGEFQQRLLRYGSSVKIEVVNLRLETIRRLAGPEAFPHPGVILPIRAQVHRDGSRDVIITFHSEPDTGTAEFGPGPGGFVRSHVHRQIVGPVLEDVVDGMTVSDKIQLRNFYAIMMALGRATIRDDAIGVKIEVGNR